MNARFKSIILSTLGVVAFIYAVSLCSSCQSDKCKAIACANKGVCKEGACICPSGYEGVQCESVTRQKFIGTWTVQETGTLSGSNIYTVSIEPNNNDSTITSVGIKNFYNRSNSHTGNGTVYAYVKGDTMYINQQVVDGDTIVGNGYLEPDAHYAEHGKLTVFYVVKHTKSDYFGYDSTGSPSVWQK